MKSTYCFTNKDINNAVSFNTQLLQSCPTLYHPMDCSPPGSSVHGFSRQEYWSGLPCPPPGVIPNLGSKLCLLCLLRWQVGSLPLVPPGKPNILVPINCLPVKYRYCPSNQMSQEFPSKQPVLISPT